MLFGERCTHVYGCVDERVYAERQRDLRRCVNARRRRTSLYGRNPQARTTALSMWRRGTAREKS